MSNNKLYRLKNAKKRKRIIHSLILLIIIFCVIFIKMKPVKKEQAVESVSNGEMQIKEKIEENKVENVVEPSSDDNENNVKIDNEIENTDTENIIVETESANVKQIIEKYIKDNNLTTDNFAFFYYCPKTLKYYFYNENKFFTAASTIKVPLAMVYYDKINNGDLTYDTEFQYKSWQYEAGTGETDSNYQAGDSIPLSFLLEQMIVNSDNTATNILKEGLGGEKAYRILIKQYTQKELPEEFNENNLTSAGFSCDVLKKLYENKDKYKDLIEFMKRSSGGGYLKREVPNVEIAHKYGSFEGNVHDFGICYTDNEYLIGVFTKGIQDAEGLIANINKEVVEVEE